ncbi:MAG: hypothetical protein Q7T51_03240 [Candidatus Moranbacteria bacterium]|nr:hypothetical protein [Candidatus Moranbacteria bacterium]
MNKFSKYNDIEAVILKADNDLVDIENRYQKSLTEENIPAELLVDIKDYLGNLKSALDYWANKYNLKYFPVCDNDKDFANKTTTIDFKIKNILSAYQPYNNNAWIKWFNILNNKSKHLTLVPQKRKESVETKVSNGSGGVSWNSGVRFGSGVRIMGVPIDPITQLPVSNNLVKTERTIWVNFIFDNTVSPLLPDNISVLPFLKECNIKIKEIINNLEKVN